MTDEIKTTEEVIATPAPAEAITPAVGTTQEIPLSDLKQTGENMIEAILHHPVAKKCGRCTKEKKDNIFDITKEYCNCGRPPKYGDELLEKAWKYVDLKMPSKDTDEVIHSIEGLTDYIDISRELAYQWGKDPEKTEFLDIMQAVLKKQGKRLVNNGLNNVFSGTIAKLILSKHGYRDAVDNFNREIPVDPAAKAAADGAIDAFLEAKK